jgi:hypothetical protein
MATGILQGVDTGIISDDTLRHTTEEVMIKAPNYWLAPSLVVLASWIRDDKDTTEKALTESLKRRLQNDSFLHACHAKIGKK